MYVILISIRLLRIEKLMNDNDELIRNTKVFSEDHDKIFENSTKYLDELVSYSFPLIA